MRKSIYILTTVSLAVLGSVLAINRFDSGTGAIAQQPPVTIDIYQLHLKTDMNALPLAEHLDMF